MYDKSYAETYTLKNLLLYHKLNLNEFEVDESSNIFTFILKSSRQDQGDLMNNSTYFKLIKTTKNNKDLNKCSEKESFN